MHFVICLFLNNILRNKVDRNRYNQFAKAIVLLLLGDGQHQQLKDKKLDINGLGIFLIKYGGEWHGNGRIISKVS